MPTTIASLIIILFAILPGLPAHKVFKIFFGSDWKATEWEKILSTIGFSASGLMIYIIVSYAISLPPPIYIFPETFNTDSFGVSSLMPIAFSFLGHTIASLLVAILAIFGIKLIAKWMPTSPYIDAWDYFIAVNVPEHWVLVHLTTGDSYAGIIGFADTSVCHAERDILLEEPAIYDENEKIYIVTPYQQLFLPAELIVSVAVAYNPKIDKPLKQIGSKLFQERKSNV